MYQRFIRLIENAVIKFSDWFQTAGAVWQTTLLCLIWIIIWGIFPNIDKHGFIFLIVISIFAALTQPALAFASKKVSDRADELMNNINDVVLDVHLIMRNQSDMMEMIIRISEQIQDGQKYFSQEILDDISDLQNMEKEYHRRSIDP